MKPRKSFSTSGSILSSIRDSGYVLEGVVIRKITGNYTVRAGESLFACVPSARLRKQSEEAIAVGDQVYFTEVQPGSGQILEILPRRNRLARRSAVPMPSAVASEQVIAANIDLVVPVFAAANPTPHWNLLDRYLVSAEAAGLSALVCITKFDLLADDAAAQNGSLAQIIEEYRRIGYPVLCVSAFSGQGIDEVREALAGKTSVLLGKSGVGKTSLLNALQPNLGLRVKEVNRTTGKGKHTTTHLEMFELNWGGALIDTPGVREFGLWDVTQDDLALFFPEMRPLVGKCKFGLDCRHDEEPGCVIRHAVMNGQISPRRYQSYMRLTEGLVG